MYFIYAISNIIDDDWIGIITFEELKSARDELFKLLDLLRPDAVNLVDSFDFPDNILCSTIGRKDGNIYEALVESTWKSPLNQTDPFEGYENLRPHLNLELLKKGNKSSPKI